MILYKIRVFCLLILSLVFSTKSSADGATKNKSYSKYSETIINLFKSHWNLHKYVTGSPATTAIINCRQNGTILNWRITKFSGNEDYDGAVMKMIHDVEWSTKLPNDENGVSAYEYCPLEITFKF